MSFLYTLVRFYLAQVKAFGSLPLSFASFLSLNALCSHFFEYPVCSEGYDEVLFS